MPGNILVVDDLESDLHSLIHELENRNFDVFRTEEKAAVLDLYQEADIDVTLLALSVSNFSGFEVLSALKSFDPDARIILYAEFSSKENIVRALRLGASEFLEKPLRVEKVLPIIERLAAAGRKDAGLQGNLKTMSLASIIQVNCEERNRALLSLNSKGREGQIFFEEGGVVHAEVNGVMGEEAIYQLLDWEEGSFTLEMGNASPLQTVEAGWSELILEGVRRIDESEAGEEAIWEETILADEETEENNSSVVERITKSISALDEVEGVVISDRNGKVLGSNYGVGDKQVAAIAKFITQHASRLASFFNAGDFKQAYMSTPNEKELILTTTDKIYYLKISKRAVADAVAETARTLIMRYHTE